MRGMDIAQALGKLDPELLELEPVKPGRTPRRFWRRAGAILAAAVMMAGCFALGVYAAGTPAGETICLPAAGLTLHLPDSWKDRYVAEVGEDGLSCNVYVKSLYDRYPGWGRLFSVGLYQNQTLTLEEAEAASPVPARGLVSTQCGTYMLYFASDLEYDPNDAAQREAYCQMRQEVSQIRVELDYVLYNSVQTCLRTLKAEAITGLSGGNVDKAVLTAALNAAAGNPGRDVEAFQPENILTLWLAGGSGENSPEDLRLELAAGPEGMVWVHYAGLGTFASENPEDPGFYLHDYDEQLWLEDQELWELLRGA